MENIIFELIIFMALLIVSGFLSASEIAISSFGENKIEDLKERKEKSARAFEKIQKDPEVFFGTIQAITIISQIAASMVAFYTAMHISILSIYNNGKISLPDSTVITILIAAIFIVAFCQIVFGLLIPKAIGFRYAEPIGLSTVNILVLLTILFRLPVKLATLFSNFLLTPFKEKTNFSQTKISEDELRVIISDGVKSGAIDETEHEIIENIFEFNDLRVNEVMIPRTEMIAIDLGEDSKCIVKDILKSGHSLIPAYENSADNIIGVLHTKDLMREMFEGKELHIRNLLRPVYFVPETKLISEILKEMQQRGERLAVVTDEYGGTEGVITMEDILEEIVGELGDKTKPEIKEYSKLPDGKFYILGSMDIADFNEKFSLQLPESDEYNTIAGFVADLSGKILNTGETVTYNNVTFELIKKIRQKMVQFKVYSSVDSLTLNE
ncbi:MAG: HlyC/CorC family transporter [Ignavibacteriaceae bacterium]|nr:HlyC/CorC family transporter [Ignavibacteriaceae bacterium]